MADKREYLIWGIGELARQAALCLGMDCVAGFVCDDRDETSSYLGKPVLSFDSLIERYREIRLVIAVSELCGIQNHLLEYGITDYQIFESNLSKDLAEKPCVLFGASYIANYAFKLIPHDNILAVCDNDSDKFGQFIEGKEIISPRELSERGYDATILITSRSINNISKQLTVLGLYRHQRLVINFRRNIAETAAPEYVPNFDFVEYFSQCTAKPIILFGSDYIEEAAEFFGAHNVFGVCGNCDSHMYRRVELDDLERAAAEYNIVLVSETPEIEEQWLASKGVSGAFRFLHPAERMFSHEKRLRLGNSASFYPLMIHLYREKPALLRGLSARNTTIREFVSNKPGSLSFPNLISPGFMESSIDVLSEIAKKYSCSSFLGLYTYPGASVGQSAPCGQYIKIVCEEFHKALTDVEKSSIIVSEPSEYDYTELKFIPDLIFIDTFDEYIYLNAVMRNILYNYSESIIVVNNLRTDAGILRTAQVGIVLDELKNFSEEIKERLYLFSDSKVGVYVPKQYE